MGVGPKVVPFSGSVLGFSWALLWFPLFFGLFSFPSVDWFSFLVLYWHFFLVFFFTFGPRPAFQANYFLGIVISVGIAWSLHLATGPLCFGGGRVWLQGSLYLPMVPFGSKPPYALLPALGPKGAGRAVGELQLRGGDMWGVGRNRFLGTTKGCVPCSGHTPAKRAYGTVSQCLAHENKECGFLRS